MGDRRNVVIKQGQDGKDGAVTFYCHWNGYRLENIVRAALKRGKSRWTDEPYLSRIIFSEIIQDEVMSELGYGIIIGEQPDEEYANIVVYTGDGQVKIGEQVWSFAEYIGLSDTPV